MNYTKLTAYLYCLSSLAITSIAGANKIAISNVEQVGMSSKRLQGLDALGKRYN